MARERIETKTTRTNNAKNDLYQWIGFFSVFQGVVLTAVAQSSTLGCQQSWAPASLSLIASVVTIVSVHFKLKSYRALEVNLANETHDSKVRTFPVYIYIHISNSAAFSACCSLENSYPFPRSPRPYG